MIVTIYLFDVPFTVKLPIPPSFQILHWGCPKSLFGFFFKILWNILNEIFGQPNTYKLNIHWKDWYWSSDTLATWCKEPTCWKRPWCWENLKAKREGGSRGWDGQMASATQWTWIWTNSGRQWKTGKPGILQPTGSQGVGHEWVTAHHHLHSKRRWETQ